VVFCIYRQYNSSYRIAIELTYTAQYGYAKPRLRVSCAFLARSHGYKPLKSALFTAELPVKKSKSHVAVRCALCSLALALVQVHSPRGLLLIFCGCLSFAFPPCLCLFPPFVTGYTVLITPTALNGISLRYANSITYNS
jgi:hypothetical protein